MLEMLPRQLLSLLLLGTCLWSNVHGTAKPNIIILLADDLGWRDIEGHDEMMRTPNILQLRSEAVFLNQSYVAPMCTPTRTALLTGRFPHTVGMQNGKAVGTSRLNWLNENLTLLPQELSNEGYQTHMVGKWHLGHCHPGLTPLERGFDTFYGFLLGAHKSYYTHMKNYKGGELYDWWDDNQTDLSAEDHYQTDLLNSRAVKIINESDSSTPFFLYQSWGAPHGPFQCPQSYQETYCSHITDSDRKIDCCMVAVLDKGVGDIVQALKDKGIYDNTVLLFLSDNGGPSKNGSSNYPLRGTKKSLYEGGIRSYTILKVPGHAQNGTIWSGLAHAVDWFPTLVKLAGGNKPSYTHGFNLWPAIQQNKSGPRKSFLMIDDYFTFNHTVFRYYKWKLLQMAPGVSNTSQWSPGYKPGWYPPYQLINASTQLSWPNEKLDAAEFRLYNLDKDPYEQEDLSHKTSAYMQGIFAKLRTELQEQLNLYPLHPFPTNLQDVENVNNAGALSINWCEPFGLQ